MAAPAFETADSAQSANGTGTSLAVTKPTGTVAGDLLIALVDVHAASQTITEPGGWTTITGNIADDDSTVNVFYKVAGGSEGATYTFSWGSGAWATIGIIRVSGADTADPIDTFASQSNNTQTCPAVTTTVDETLLLRAFGGQAGGNTRAFDPPVGTTERWDKQHTAGSGSAGSAGATAELASAGSSGTAAWTRTLGGVVTTMNVTVAIAPAAAGGGTILPQLMQHYYGGVA